jgi:hypothetical protein
MAGIGPRRNDGADVFSAENAAIGPLLFAVIRDINFFVCRLVDVLAQFSP